MRSKPLVTRPARALSILCLVALLASCGLGEFFIKRSIVNLEGDIAKELKSYASFDAKQEAEIEQIARTMSNWMRGERLPLLVSELELVAQEIEQNGELSEQRWRSFVSFMEAPFELSQAPGLLAQLSNVIHGMSEDQIEQASKKIVKDHKKKIRELDKTTADDQADKIVDGIKAVFKDIGIKRSSEQLKQATLMLKKRTAYIELDKQTELEGHQDFMQMLRDRNVSNVEFEKRFTQLWMAIELSPKDRLPDQWENNLTVSHEMMNFLLSDLTKEQSATAAKSIRDYANLFEELSQID